MRVSKDEPQVEMVRLPVHWAGFALSYQHTWCEPATEFRKAAETRGLACGFPTLGSTFTVNDVATAAWWHGH